MPRFEFADQIALGQQHVVATHEAAHAVVGYFYGERIGLVRLAPVGGGLWGGGHIHEAPPTFKARTVYPECIAHRLLAGEVAARVVAGLGRDRIHVPLSDAELIRWYWRVAPLARRIQNQPDDAWKVLALARENHRLLWWSWIWRQHARTCTLVEEHFHFVRDLAVELVRFAASTLPTNNFQGRRAWAMPGATIVATLRRLGCPVFDSSFFPTSLP